MQTIKTCLVCGTRYEERPCPKCFPRNSAAPIASQRSEVGSTDWVDALAKRWERRSANIGDPPPGYHMGQRRVAAIESLQRSAMLDIVEKARHIDRCQISIQSRKFCYRTELTYSEELTGTQYEKRSSR